MTSSAEGPARDNIWLAATISVKNPAKETASSATAMGSARRFKLTTPGMSLRSSPLSRGPCTSLLRAARKSQSPPSDDIS